MSKATILRKEENPAIADKRYRTHYFIHRTLGEVLEQAISERLVEHAQARGQSQLVRSWMEAWEITPLTLNRLTTTLMLGMRHTGEAGVSDTCRKVTKVIGFHVAEGEQLDAIVVKLRQLLTDLQSQISESRRDWKKPLKRPIALSITVVTVNPEEICDAAGAQVKLVKSD